ncbi:MAG: glucose-6-phosphate dehydrogenase [Phycisphaeraceae bacterium]|nr:glucose-6-phosphate dehydrogenase [Phycisphaerales bacterium]MCB9861568.1 glucose-6-phosphate dehydrogenase [Phycisphaeraceae bacterium]
MPPSAHRHDANGTIEPCLIVLFGASGDLTWRKLIPALFDREQKGKLPESFAVLGVSRTKMSDDEWRDKLGEKSKLDTHGGTWAKFAQRLHYHPADATKQDDYPGLVQRISELNTQHALERCDGAPNLLFYLSVAPQLYEGIIQCLGDSGLVTEGRRWCSLHPDQTSWQRIIVEKPFGTDLASAVSLNRALGRVFDEDAIFRIDHYLGKELVQNITALRFANSIFEPLWSARHIDHIQVTAAESLGVGRRAGTFYDQAGALRDMIQSHLLQVLTHVLIEAPSSFKASSLMRERIKLFESVRPIPTSSAHEHAVFGRYGPSKDEPAYVDAEGVDPLRNTETYAAMRIQIDNWRWAGMPIFLRSGKKMAEKRTEIVIQFRKPPLDMFPDYSKGLGNVSANRLVIRIAPHEGIDLSINGKVPGTSFQLATAELDMDYVDRFGGEPVEAYGPLIVDAIRGDRTLYKHRDEVEGAWRVCQPLLDNDHLREQIHTYDAGSWGPAAADELLTREGCVWHNISTA